MLRRSLGVSSVLIAVSIVGGMAAHALSDRASVTVYPSADGTLRDGITGPAFDGVVDAADWYFNGTHFDGFITLSNAPGTTQFEDRLVWEYNINTVTFTPPVYARLDFVLRGAAADPRPDVDVHVYSYPADLAETNSDFSAGPAVLQGFVTVPPFQLSTAYSVEVSQAVNAVLNSGSTRVAFRFQVDPQAPPGSYQAFSDAVDANPTTKPALVISDTFPPVPGDADLDRDVDLFDHEWFAYCMNGPATPAPAPAECARIDLNTDTDVDLHDFASFQNLFGVSY